MRKFKKIKVSEYSGYKIDEKPKKFFYRNRSYIVEEILETHYEKDTVKNKNYMVFTIKTKEGEIFKLFNLLNKPLWFVEEI